MTTEAKGFTEARSAERGRVGEGKFFEKLHQNGAFWVHFEVIQYTFLSSENLYEKNVSH